MMSDQQTKEVKELQELQELKELKGLKEVRKDGCVIKGSPRLRCPRKQAGRASSLV